MFYNQPNLQNTMKNSFSPLFVWLVPLVLLVSCGRQPAVNLHIPTQSFNDGWLFFYGEAEGAEAIGFDDSNWQSTVLPHDWAIAGPFDPKHNARTGGLPVTGTGWYRKQFEVPAAYEGKRTAVVFDGAMSNAQVYVNGQLVTQRPYGYIGFESDMTPYIKYGAKNTIAVKLHNEIFAMRWYPGAGLYRNTWLKYDESVHVPNWGVYITTPSVSASQAVCHVSTTIENTSDKHVQVALSTTVMDAKGTVVTQEDTVFSINGPQPAIVSQRLAINQPNLWGLNHPYLYQAKTVLLAGKDTLDMATTPFGVRTIAATADQGFLLNGKRVQFNGVCMHHDLGPLGTAVNERAIERQLQIMQSMGANAIRTAHNPPAPEVLDACDRLGLLVIVEAFDEWKMGKVKNGYNKYFDQWHERDLRDMIKRDRNHPSVIMWSIGNEILEQGRKDGWKLAKKLNDICHDEDPTRPTTVGFNYYPAPFDNQLAQQVDVVGLNYWPLQYNEVKEKFPDMVVYGSETASQTSSRGVYHLPIQADFRRETGQVSSYDVIVGPPWAYPPDVEFDALANAPHALGEFIWTGFDYLGEPTPYSGRDNSTNGYWNDDWPSRSSYFAPVDLCGFPKDRYYLYQSQWTEAPMVHVLPHWNWEGQEGKPIPIFAYTNAAAVELFVNGKSFGKQTKGENPTMIPAEYHGFKLGKYPSKYRLSWEVPFTPGSIRVVAYNGDQAVAEKTVNTAGAPAKIVISPDRKTIKADGKDLSFVTVRIEDEAGNLCPFADHKVSFEATGAGNVVAVGNGNARSLEPYQATYRKAFSGMCLVIIKAGNTSGEIALNATAEGLRSAQTTITVE